jgi:hypothetical protein
MESAMANQAKAPAEWAFAALSAGENTALVGPAAIGFQDFRAPLCSAVLTRAALSKRTEPLPAGAAAVLLLGVLSDGFLDALVDALLDVLLDGMLLALRFSKKSFESTKSDMRGTISARKREPLNTP